MKVIIFERIGTEKETVGNISDIVFKGKNASIAGIEQFYYSDAAILTHGPATISGESVDCYQVVDRASASTYNYPVEKYRAMAIGE